MASHDPSAYRFSTPAYIALYTLLLTAYYVYDLYFYTTAHLHTNTDANEASIPRCPRSRASECKCRESPNSAMPSLNFRGASLRTLALSRPSIGTFRTVFQWPVRLIHFQQQAPP